MSTIQVNDLEADNQNFVEAMKSLSAPPVGAITRRGLRVVRFLIAVGVCVVSWRLIDCRIVSGMPGCTRYWDRAGVGGHHVRCPITRDSITHTL